LWEVSFEVKKGEVKKDLISDSKKEGLEFILEGRGIIGAVAALPFFTEYKEALLLWTGSA
jgi:tRNA(Ile2) C34 agmatinyltransferase TiaS